MNWYSSGDVPPGIDWDQDLVVHVPAAVGRKQPLLRVLRTGLMLPGYFGENWDALEECLRDLWWLPEGQRVWLIHADVPFSAGSANRSTYLAVLRESVEHWRSQGSADRLNVCFPEPV